MANLILVAELQLDPLGRGYAGMTHSQAAVDLNTRYRQVLEVLPAKELTLWAADVGRLQKIKTDFERSNASNALRSACGALYLLVASYSDVDPRDSRWNTLLNFLVSSNTLTQADKDALVAAATILRSRGEELGLGVVAPGEVSDARAAFQ